MNVQEARDWVDNLDGDFHAVTDLWMYTGDSELDSGDSVPLRYIEREQKIFFDESYTGSHILFEMPNCTHGDYVGDVVTMANFQVLTSEKFLEDNDLPAHIIGLGSYSSCALYYSLCTATQTQLDNLKEIVEDLVQYPVVSDDAWTTLECEIIDNDIYDGLTWEVERELSNMDRDDIVDWYDERKGVNAECIGDLLFEMMTQETFGYIEAYVEGIHDVVYGEDYKWFAERVIELFDKKEE